MADREFKLGLALSGAISAGAYSAGVIDFLAEALEGYEAARGLDGAPSHRVGLKVVAGASAGAITGALGLIAMVRGARPIPLGPGVVPAAGPGVNPYRCVLPMLYETWVERPRLVAGPAGGTDFLDTSDLRGQGGEAPVAGSLLNSKLLDDIKDAALAGAGPVSPRPFLADNLHLYVTVSNLRGIPFEVDFGEGSYGFLTHGDRVHYRLAGFGTWPCADTPWVAGDPGLRLDAATLPVARSDEVTDLWKDYGTAALASAAFPIGLGSRVISMPFSQYQNRSWPFDVVKAQVIQPKFRGPTTPTFKFLNIDGGLINNNPFDYVEYALFGQPPAAPATSDAKPDHGPERTAEAGRTASGAVVMIAPFPEPPTFLPEGEPKAEISALIRALFPTLIGQARFRSSDLVQALDPDVYSRFLISPRRTPPGSTEPCRFPIACGALGGFGGFLDREFRAHDYQLGRRNCQAFLRGTFGLPCGAAAIDTRPGHRLPPRGLRPESAPILPLLGPSNLDIELPPWPRMKRADLCDLMQRIDDRLGTLLPILIATETTSRLLRLIGKMGLLIGRRRLLDGIRYAILSDLIRRDQVEGFGPESASAEPFGDVREVIAELACPTYDFRCVVGIAKATHLGPDRVQAIIDRLLLATNDTRVVTAPGDSGLYTLALRAPKGVQAWPGVGAFLRLFDSPRDDREKAAAAA